MTVYYIYREFLGPLISGALTEFFDFQSSAVVSERDKINFFVKVMGESSIEIFATKKRSCVYQPKSACVKQSN